VTVEYVEDGARHKNRGAGAVLQGSGGGVGSGGQPEDLCRAASRPYIFHAQNTAWAAEQVNRAVRERYPSSEEVVVASVVDLNLVPPLYWLTASMMIGQAYEKAAREVVREGFSGVDPTECVLILQDWGSLISRRFGVRGIGREAAVVVIDESAEIAGFYQGSEPVEAVLRMLEGG
jgi:hypothetical protein